MRKTKRVIFQNYQRENDHNVSPAKPKRGRPKKLRDDLTGKQPTLVQEPSKRVEKMSSSNRNPNNTILSCLIDNNVVVEGAKVYYRPVKIRPKLTEGRITRYGIECDCCQKIFALSEFEVHAGSTRHRPSANIILYDGRTLTDCQEELAGEGKRGRITRIHKTKNPKEELPSEGKRERITGNPDSKTTRRKKVGHSNNVDSDNICSFCYYGGDLVLCDRCPSAFHKDCLGLKEVPDGEWFCPFCCCNICGQNKLLDNDVQQDGFILSCDQCPRKFHVACARSRGLIKLERKSTCYSWFCSDKCEYVFSGLQHLLGKSVPVGTDNLTWTLLKRVEPDCFDLEVLSANNSKLKLALEVMHECFEPAKDAFTGKDLVEDVIFSSGSNLNRLNFLGFYTVLLERNNELTTVANVRVFGDKVAEVPFVATKFQYRRLGMCRVLMNELERQLLNLGVEKLVLPAAFSTLETWIKGFGFSVMTDSDKKAHSDYPILFFQGTVLCQKFLKRSLLQD